MYDHYDGDPKKNVPTAQFHTADDPGAASVFPAHYRLYVLEAKGDWHHGETRGVAVSRGVNEVVW